MALSEKDLLSALVKINIENTVLLQSCLQVLNIIATKDMTMEKKQEFIDVFNLSEKNFREHVHNLFAQDLPSKKPSK